MHVFVLALHLADELVGGALLGADVLGRGDKQLHVLPLAQLEQGGDGFAIKPRRFVEEQQAAGGDVLAAQTAGLLLPADQHHQQDGLTGTDRLAGGERAALGPQPAIGAALHLDLQLQIVAIVEQHVAHHLIAAIPLLHLRVEALEQLGHRLGEAELLVGEQIVVHGGLIGQRGQQTGVGLADIDVEAHPAHQTEGNVLQALVEHPDAVLLAADDVGDLGRHLVGGERQMGFPLLELVGQTGQLDLHLLDGLHRIIGADDVVADAIFQVTVDLHVEGHLLLGAAVAFRQSQRIAQGLVMGHRHPQGAEGLV